MIERYKHIFMLYLRNPAFALLFGCYLALAAVSKVFYHAGNSYYGEEIFTMLFVATLWMVFQMGLVIKRQFANHRASLIPGYRRPHIHLIFLWYLLFILTIYLWEKGLVLNVPITLRGLTGIYLTCFFLALCITYLGYLSVGRALMYAYVAVLVLSTQSFGIIIFVDQSPYWNYVMVFSNAVLIVCFRQRLLRLKEESFEYDYLFSWPPKRFIENQLKSQQLLEGIFAPMRKSWRAEKETAPIPPYPREKSMVARAYHWDHIERADIKIVWLLVAFIMPVYLFLNKGQPAIELFFKNTYSTFLLLTITPILAAIGAQYKKMAYWGYDLLKPVKREQYLKERGIVIFSQLFLYWLLFSLCFAVLPSLMLQPEILTTARFWGYLFSTGSFAFVILSWMALLSCIKRPHVVILNGIVLGSILLVQFYFASTFSAQVLLWINVIFLAGGAFLLKWAYYAWRQREFD